MSLDARAWSRVLPLVILAACAAPRVTFEGLLEEMTDPRAIARLPAPPFRSLQASSYNRESTLRGAPGWFADSDGIGFLREEQLGGRKEWVLMEADGPGCLTRVWTPFFYLDFNERTGPNVRVWIDGAREPVLDEPLIRLVRGEGSIGAPFAAPTARAGDLYLPIPFARSCRITMDQRPFYFLVNYRSYDPGVEVESFSRALLAQGAPALARAAEVLTSPAPALGPRQRAVIAPGTGCALATVMGSGMLREFELVVPDLVHHPELLRQLVLMGEFDRETTLWCPLGDFFSSPDALHPFRTLRREVDASGRLRCRWPMPFEGSALLALMNHSAEPLEIEYATVLEPFDWDQRALHFHAGWRPDEVVPGTPFRDWTFLDARGNGVYAGDSWTVLNPQKGTWWGEGDEKIYVDGAYELGFPTHFGTGSEDYYGWAGGEVPTRRDEFSHPFLANVRVGGLDGTTLGYNINTRERGLDAIPFTTRLRFDMEASFGTDIRGPRDHLGYSVAVMYYARPGARDDLAGIPTGAAPVMHLVEDGERLKVELGAR